MWRHLIILILVGICSPDKFSFDQVEVFIVTGEFWSLGDEVSASVNGEIGEFFKCLADREIFS